MLFTVYDANDSSDFLRVLRQPLLMRACCSAFSHIPLFGPAPDSVIQTAYPPVFYQIAQLGFIKLVAEIFAQIGKRSRFAEDPFAIAAVSPRDSGGPSIRWIN